MPKSNVIPILASIQFKRGALLATEMLNELEENPDPLADNCQLQGCFRTGPFRNIVAERLSGARAEGTEIEQGFCAVLSHIVALNALGFVPRASEVEETIRGELSGVRRAKAPVQVLSGAERVQS